MTKYRIAIDRSACLGDNLCCEEAQNTFAIDDSGRARVIDPDGDADESILSAAVNCPVGGIRLFDRDSGEERWPTGPTRREHDTLRRRREEVREETRRQEYWSHWRDVGAGD